MYTWAMKCIVKNQEIWNSKEQELKHKMNSTGTGGGKNDSYSILAV